MPDPALFDPVTGDEVPTVDDAVAVGEDLHFQEHWWRFERVIWTVFLLILVADVLGVFGRGWLAKAKLNTPDGSIRADYERVQRNGTPSILRVDLSGSAVQNGEARLFVSESLVREFGMQRVIPQPEHSVLRPGGVLYEFPAQGSKFEVQFELEPSFPGVHPFSLEVPGGPSAGAHVLVMP